LQAYFLTPESFRLMPLVFLEEETSCMVLIWSSFLWQNGATYCTSELAILKNNEIHTWDRGYDDGGNQVAFMATHLIWA
jgi:hypothetical protein